MVCSDAIYRVDSGHVTLEVPKPASKCRSEPAWRRQGSGTGHFIQVFSSDLPNPSPDSYRDTLRYVRGPVILFKNFHQTCQTPLPIAIGIRFATFGDRSFSCFLIEKKNLSEAQILLLSPFKQGANGPRTERSGVEGRECRRVKLSKRGRFDEREPASTNGQIVEARTLRRTSHQSLVTSYQK